MSRWFRPICAQRGCRLWGGLLIVGSVLLRLVVARPVTAQERPAPLLKGGISIDVPTDNAGDQFNGNTNPNADCEQRYAQAEEAVREERSQSELQYKNDRIDCRGNASCQQQASAKYVTRSGEIIKKGNTIAAQRDICQDRRRLAQYLANDKVNDPCARTYAQAEEAVREERSQSELQYKNDRIDCRGNASCQQQASAKYVTRSGEIIKKGNTIAAQRDICQDRRRLAKNKPDEGPPGTLPGERGTPSQPVPSSSPKGGGTQPPLQGGVEYTEPPQEGGQPSPQKGGVTGTGDGGETHKPTPVPPSQPVLPPKGEVGKPDKTPSGHNAGGGCMRGSLSDNAAVSVTVKEFINYLEKATDGAERAFNGRYKVIRDDSGHVKKNFRYVQTPHYPEAIIDMRHFQFVGPLGQWIGDVIECAQGRAHQASAYQRQDFYSNDLGERFRDFNNMHPNGSYTDNLKAFFGAGNEDTLNKTISYWKGLR